MDCTHFDDDLLLRLIAQTHDEALSELYDRYSRLVYSVALNATGEPQQAEDITQDVFLRVWERAETYHNELGRVATWLAGITRNRSIDILRRGKVRRENLIISWDEAEYIDSPAPQNVEAEVELKQHQKRVRWAVSQLPDEQKQALALAYFQGLTHPEIALALGEPLGTVKTRIRLGMQKLRQLLISEPVD